jgi:hypothetical protein
MAHTTGRGYTENGGGKTQEKLKKSSRISQGNWTHAKVKTSETEARPGWQWAEVEPRAYREEKPTDPPDPRRAIFA